MRMWAGGCGSCRRACVTECNVWIAVSPGTGSKTPQHAAQPCAWTLIPLDSGLTHPETRRLTHPPRSPRWHAARRGSRVRPSSLPVAPTLRSHPPRASGTAPWQPAAREIQRMVPAATHTKPRACRTQCMHAVSRGCVTSAGVKLEIFDAVFSSYHSARIDQAMHVKKNARTTGSIRTRASTDASYSASMTPHGGIGRLTLAEVHT